MKFFDSKNAGGYAVAFCAFLLLFCARVNSDAPFSLGLFSALTYAGMNVLVLSPIYVLSAFLINPSAQSVISALCPAVILTAAYAVHFFARRKLGTVHMAAYSLIASVPSLLIFSPDPLRFATYVVLSGAFAYVAVIAVYALVVRGVGYRLSADEAVCSALLVAALSCGLFSFEVVGFKIYYAVSVFVVLYSTFAFGYEGAGIAFAVGAGGGSLEMIAASVSWFIVAGVFKKNSRILSSISVIIADLLVCQSDISELRIISVAIGALAFLLLSASRLEKMVGFFTGFGESYSSRLLVNRNREDVSAKLSEVAHAFYSAETLICGEKQLPNNEEITRALTAELSSRFCDGCPGKIGCYKLLGGSADGVMQGIVSSAVENGRATVLDLPPYLTGSCPRVGSLIDDVNTLAEKFRDKMALRENADSIKKLLSAEMSGVGKMMDEIRESLRVPLGFDRFLETKIADALNYVNVSTACVAVYGEGRGLRVSLVVREGDENRPALVRAVSSVLKMKMTAHVGRKDNGVEVWLTPSPKYEVLFGRATRAKDGNENGDSFGILRLPDGRAVLAISDGMGNGETAGEESRGVMGITENFFRAGFRNETVIPVLNRLMTLRGGESFQTLDMCVINTLSGNADIVKLGASESIIKRKNGVQVISGSALPIGILDEVKPYITTVNLSEDDAVVMCSDGLIDALGRDAVIRYVEANSALNPQTVADGLLNESKKAKYSDDVTVLAARIFEKT